MLTRRSFIAASCSTMATLSLLGAGHAASMTQAGSDALVIYSKARLPAAAAIAKSHMVLGDDLTTNLCNLQDLLRQAPSQPIVLELDAADEMLFDIAHASVAAQYIPAGRFAQAALV